MRSEAQKKIVSALTISSIRILAAVVTGLPVAILCSGGGISLFQFGDMQLVAVLLACSLFSIIVRTGPLIPCVVIGTTLGFWADHGVKGGSIESQMWETVNSITLGFVGGLVCGFVADSSAFWEAMWNPKPDVEAPSQPTEFPS